MTAQPQRAEEALTLDYDLFDLPTAQHKAGLAGLLLHLRSLEEREIEPRPEVEALDRHSATVRFSEASLTTLFDDLYAARMERVESRSKWAKRTPLDEITVEVTREGKTVSEKRFIYEDLRPSGPPLEHWRPGGNNDPWLKLWQGMLWSVLRAQAKSRIEFQVRTPDQHAGLATKLWEKLRKAQARRTKGAFVTESIAGSLFIGAQDKNAERVSFVGRIEHNLLLHFWQWATPIFVPRSLDPRKGTWEYRGFLLSVPEIADLETFCDDMEHFWRDLDPATAGYRPAEALIDLPEEGGLEFLHHLAEHKLDKADLGFSVHSLELYHQEKQGNNVRQLSATRLAPSTELLISYERIRGDRKKHPLFKRLQIGNLVQSNPWFHGAMDLFDRYPEETFILGPGSPRGRPFATDVHHKFEQTINDLEKREMTSQPIPEDEPLQRLIYKLIRSYVDKRSRDRARLGDTPVEKMQEAERARYREARPKVAGSAFLALRARRDQDISEYFTGTLCAPGYHLKEDDFLLLADALLKQPETVKSLAMLALSAHSWTPREKKEGEETDASSNQPNDKE